MTKTEALQQRKELLKLIKQWTRAEIMARIVCSFSDCTDYFEIKLRKEDEIRYLLFGDSDLVNLGHEWGMLS